MSLIDPKETIPEIRQAIEEGKFLVTVKYLPDNPRIQRFPGWKILP